MGNGLAHAGIIQRRLGRIDEGDRGTLAVTNDSGQLRVLLRIHDGTAAVGPDQVDLTGTQAGKAGLGIGQDAEDDLVEMHRVLVPVIRVPLDGDAVATGPVVEHERASADRLPVLLVGGDIGTRRDQADHARRREVAQQRQPGMRQIELDGVVVDGLDTRYRRDERPAARLVLRVEDAIEVVSDILGGEVGAVMELDALAQGQGPALVVFRRFPGGCQIGFELLGLLVVLQQRVVNGQRDRSGADAQHAALDGIEAARVGLDADGQGAALHRAAV